MLPKKYTHRKTYNKSKSTNILSANRYELLEPISENIELVSKNIQNTDTLWLPGNTIYGNRNALNSPKMAFPLPCTDGNGSFHKRIVPRLILIVFNSSSYGLSFIE